MATMIIITAAANAISVELGAPAADDVVVIAVVATDWKGLKVIPVIVVGASDTKNGPSTDHAVL